MNKTVYNLAKAWDAFTHANDVLDRDDALEAFQALYMEAYGIRPIIVNGQYVGIREI